jgi:hypothetical protein
VVSITIPVVQDSLAEGGESFRLTLFDAVNATLRRAAGTIIIVDDEAAPPPRTTPRRRSAR